MATRRRYPLTERQRVQIALDECLSTRSIRRWEIDPDSVAETIRIRCERGCRRLGIVPETLPRAA